MSIRTLVLTSIVALAAPVASQSFGVAYAGGHLSPCLDMNATPDNTSWLTIWDERGFAVTNTTGNTLTIQGLGFWAEQVVSPSVSVHVYLASSSGGPQPTPVRTGTLFLDYTQSYRQAGFPPLSIPNGDTVFVSIEGDVTFRYKLSPYGTPTASYNYGSKWVGSYMFRPCFRLLCWRQFELAAPIVHGVGDPLVFDVDLAVQAPAVLFVGFSTTSWNGLPLPFDLGRFGATGATLYVEPMIQLPLVPVPGGHLQTSINIPPRAGLHGVQLHTQALGFIRDANPLGLGTSNGFTTTLSR